MTAQLAGLGQSTWMAEGACRTEDPELFFPVSATEANARQVEQAVTVCHRCRVETTCLRYALANGVKYGIWGGRTEQERLAAVRGDRTTAAARLRHPARDR